MRRIRDFMPATLSVGVRPMPAIVAATSKDVAWLLPRDPHDATLALLPRAAQISFTHQGHLVVLRGTAQRTSQGTVAFHADREGRVDNLRAAPRLDVQLPVQIIVAGATQATRTINLSAGGALLEGSGFGAADDEVEIEVTLPQETVVRARGAIVRLEHERTGLRFTDIDAAAREHIDAMVLSIRAQLARRFAEKAEHDEAVRAAARAARPQKL